MSTKRLIEISQSAAIPIPAWLLILAVGGIFTLAYRVHEWESQLKSVTEAIDQAWTIPMEKETWSNFVTENRMKYPDMIPPNIMQVFRDNR